MRVCRRVEVLFRSRACIVHSCFCIYFLFFPSVLNVIIKFNRRISYTSAALAPRVIRNVVDTFRLLYYNNISLTRVHNNNNKINITVKQRRSRFNINRSTRRTNVSSDANENPNG